jgi:hypothetical protein
MFLAFGATFWECIPKKSLLSGNTLPNGSNNLRPGLVFCGAGLSNVLLCFSPILGGRGRFKEIKTIKAGNHSKT